MISRSPSAAAHSQGFVLPVVAIAIAIFALSVLTLVSTIDGAAVRVARSQADAAFERRAVSAEARVSFLLSTEPLRAGGLAVGADRGDPMEPPVDPQDRRVKPVQFDGRSYVTMVEGRAMLVSVQDTAGLLNVNSPDPSRLARLVERFVDDAGVATRVAARVADYADADSERRQGGAERVEYARLGAREPRNAPVGDVAELHDVLDWDTLVPGARAPALLALTRAAPTEAGLNVNTAPADGIAAAFGIDDGRARQIVDRRARQPVRTTDDLAAIAGGGLQVEGLSLVAAPARALRLTVRDAAPGQPPRRATTSLIFAESVETPPIGVGPREISPDPEQRSSDERPEPLPSGGHLPPR